MDQIIYMHSKIEELKEENEKLKLLAKTPVVEDDIVLILFDGINHINNISTDKEVKDYCSSLLEVSYDNIAPYLENKYKKETVNDIVNYLEIKREAAISMESTLTTLVLESIISGIKTRYNVS